MLPEARLSTTPVIAQFKSADALARGRLQDFEQGGIAIGDPTQGLEVQAWEIGLLGNAVRVRPEGGAWTTIFTASDVTSLSLTFDQNMNPTVAFTAGGVCKLRWYDPTPAVEDWVITSYPGTRDIRICLDDKREGLRDLSDILVFYLKDAPSVQPQSLYMRLQRDRYGVEYNLGSLPVGTKNLDAVGMAKNHRLRVNLFGLYPPAGEDGRPAVPFPPGMWPDGLILKFDGVEYEPLAPGFAILDLAYIFYIPPVSDPL